MNLICCARMRFKSKCLPERGRESKQGIRCCETEVYSGPGSLSVSAGQQARGEGGQSSLGMVQSHCVSTPLICLLSLFCSYP